MQSKKKQVVLIVLDGWGYREDTKDNAIAAARTPNFDRYWKEYPHTLLEASGLAVGLPQGQMGNSEVGHTTIGAGTVVDTDLVRIAKAISTGEYDSNPAFTALFDHVKKNNSTLHVQGLLGDGGVHSHQDHLFAFLRAAQKAGIKRIALHIFTDGRDTAPQSAAGYLKELEAVLAEITVAFIATLSGRFYAMDRDNNWDRLVRVEQALFECKGNVCEIKDGANVDSATGMQASDFVQSLYAEGKVDEHLEPTVFVDAKGMPLEGAAIKPHDSVFFFNFRADRARMLSKKILEKAESQDIYFVTLTSYGSEFTAHVAFPQVSIETTLAKEVSAAGLTQAHIAETEKYPHATYFLNGGMETPYPGEKHIMLASRKDVPTHDLAPKMRAEAIADKAIEEISAGTDFIFINFANADMVGHTANVPAIIESVEEADTQFGRVVAALIERAKTNGDQGIAFVTADHGNAETNIDQETGTKHTSHTLNLVPAIVTAHDIDGIPLALRPHGGLADITPTVLSLFGIKKPEKMSGSSLIEK